VNGSIFSCRVLNPGPKEVAQRAINKLGGPPDFLGGDAEGDAAVESARMKERERSGPPAPSVSLASKQDVLEQSAMAGDNDWGCAASAFLITALWSQGAAGWSCVMRLPWHANVVRELQGHLLPMPGSVDEYNYH